MINPYRCAEFVLSAAKINQLPSDEGYEIAFAGRSNAGKSSAINTLTNQKSLARTSKTPGRTQLLNYFRLDDEHRLVDLPGYGYAKVPESVKQNWHKLLDAYLSTRKSLVGLVLVMDVRHPLREFDHMMLTWSVEIGMPVHILLTKSDKLKKGPANNSLLAVTKITEQAYPQVTVQLFSSLKHVGIEQLVRQLNHWNEYNLNDEVKA